MLIQFSLLGVVSRAYSAESIGYYTSILFYVNLAIFISKMGLTQAIIFYRETESSKWVLSDCSQLFVQY